MKQLRVCSSLNLHAYPKESLSDYIRQGLLFHKEACFDGLLNYEVSTGRIPATMRDSFAAYVLNTAKVLTSYIE